MRRALIAIILTVVSAVAPARADEPVVVELFTSQGCSACPPADALMAELAGRPDLIALALHVDYWDYIGWTDAFADPAYTRRQKGYARAHGGRTIYTPQMVVGGRTSVVGHKPMMLAERIAEIAALPPRVRLAVQRSGDEVAVRVAAIEPVAAEVVIQLIRFRPSETVAIKRGENAGHTFTYHNVVTDWQVVATWNGRDALALRHPAPGTLPAVVIAQEAGYGAILAAARAR